LCHNGWEAPCRIFSIEFNDECGSERQILKQAPHSTTHTFDCTMEPKRKPKSPKFQFYLRCLTGEREPQTRLSFLWTPGRNDWSRSAETTENRYRGILIGCPATPTARLQHGPSRSVHWATRMMDIPWMLRTQPAAEMSLWFAVLFTVGGYLPVTREFFFSGLPQLYGNPAGTNRLIVETKSKTLYITGFCR
jgi:hypothetical protein